MDHQSYEVNLLDSTKSPYYGNFQKQFSRFENTNIMPSVNFDSNSTSTISTTTTVIQTRNSLESEQNYNFKSKGKYTTQFSNNLKKETEAFRFDGLIEENCSEHKLPRNIIVIEAFGPFAKYQVICQFCQSDYNGLRRKAGIRNSEGSILCTDVIRDNAEKIVNIRNGQLSITNVSDTSKCSSMLYDELMPLADELIDIVHDFNEEIICHFDGSGANNEELMKIKSFIDQMPLINGTEPDVRHIGEDVSKRNKYINLAIFLLNFTKINTNVNLSGVSASLKNQISRIVSLRKCIVVQITKWLKFVLGDFYDFIFRAEGIPVDEDFRRSIKVDFFSEEEIRKITFFFESEISKRDSRIRFLEEELVKRDFRIRLLEEENDRYKKELESLRGNLCVMAETEENFNNLQDKFDRLEMEWQAQKLQIEKLIAENQRLNAQNSEYYNEINNMHQEIEDIKNNFEITLKNTINELRMQYEVQIGRISEDFNELKNKYQSDANKWMAERDSLTNRIQILMSEIESYKERINSMFEEMNNLNNQLQKLKQELALITQERETQNRNIESLRNEIRSYQTNIGNLNNQLSIALKARDELTLKVDELNREINQLKSTVLQMTNEIQVYNQKIEMYINNFNVVSKERDELRQQVILFRGELDKKTSELQNIQNIRVSLENRVNQLESEIRRITEMHTKLQYEFNQKLMIIGDLEKRVRELEGSNLSANSLIETHLTSIQKYDLLMIQVNEDHLSKVMQLERMVNELRDRERELTMQLKERDNEVARLRVTITACREDWNKLSESYESLLYDIKNQINTNEVLRNLVFELLNKIEMHNQNVGGLDMAIKQQIEILTRQSLAKKAIDIDRNYKQDISTALNNIEGLRQKLGKIETQKLNKSAVFNNINFSSENFKSSTINNMDEITQRFLKNSINKSGFNFNEFTPSRNTNIKTDFSKSIIREVNYNATEVPFQRKFTSTTYIDTTTNKAQDLIKSVPRDNQNRVVIDTTDIMNNTVVLRSEDQ